MHHTTINVVIILYMVQYVTADMLLYLKVFCIYSRISSKFSGASPEFLNFRKCAMVRNRNPGCRTAQFAFGSLLYIFL
jgi:hypothetical protein